MKALQSVHLRKMTKLKFEVDHTRREAELAELKKQLKALQEGEIEESEVRNC